MALPLGTLTLQFHPDWPHGERTVIESMAVDGRYRSQCATGTSNGGLTAHRHGDRWRWESRLFDGRYDSADQSTRPVYGAWNRRDDPYGGAVRFGSSYVQLKADVVERATFCFPDSVFEPQNLGGPEDLHTLCSLADATELDHLDDYVEAHVHGGVSFYRDVDIIVLDPSFEGTTTAQAASALGCPVHFHQGFAVTTSNLDTSYRDAETVEIAKSLGPKLTAESVGRAARSGHYEQQSLKKVWHYLARFGRSPDRLNSGPRAWGVN
ncbi:MAG: DUF3626 domain-containing protein [Rhodococcus sp. (in: high G+C Gram-positive bacteria)]